MLNVAHVQCNRLHEKDIFVILRRQDGLVGMVLVAVRMKIMSTLGDEQSSFGSVVIDGGSPTTLFLQCSMASWEPNVAEVCDFERF